MTTETVKSGTIANLDSAPVVVNTAGFGGLAVGKFVNGSVTATNGATAGSIYQLVRIRSNAVVKHLRIKIDNPVTTFAGDIGCYYSTAPLVTSPDGTVPQNAGLVVNGATGRTVFAAGADLHDQVTFVDLADDLTAAQLNQELWAACGLATDPGGFFDIVITTTATNSGAPVVYIEANITD